MKEFLIYIIGYVLFIIFYFIYVRYCQKKKDMPTKLLLYRGVKYGFTSWIGLFFCTAVFIVGGIAYGIFSLDEFIEKKLGRKR